MIDLDRWAASIDGRLLDLDVAPAGAPYQCHDVWLSYLYALGGKPGDGYAPGTGFTDQVWRQFPVTERTGRLFTKHGPGTIKRGDVVFWSAYDGNGLPHVAVALADAFGPTVYCLTQNPGKVRREYLTRHGVLGVLRPIITKPKPKPKPKPTPAPTPKGSPMYMIYTNTGGKLRWAVVGPGFFLPVSSQAEASGINRQLSGSSAPAVQVSAARWAEHQAAARGPVK